MSHERRPNKEKKKKASHTAKEKKAAKRDKKHAGENTTFIPRDS